MIVTIVLKICLALLSIVNSFWTLSSQDGSRNTKRNLFCNHPTWSRRMCHFLFGLLICSPCSLIWFLRAARKFAVLAGICRIGALECDWMIRILHHGCMKRETSSERATLEIGWTLFGAMINIFPPHPQLGNRLSAIHVYHICMKNNETERWAGPSTYLEWACIANTNRVSAMYHICMKNKETERWARPSTYLEWTCIANRVSAIGTH